MTLSIGTEVARLYRPEGSFLILPNDRRERFGRWPRWGDRVTHRFRALTRPRKLPLGHALGILSVLLAGGLYSRVRAP